MSVTIPQPLQATSNVIEPSGGRRAALRWFVAGAALAFFVPFVAVDLLALHHDLFLLIDATLVVVFLAAFAAHNKLDWRSWLRHRPGWSAAVGVVVAVALVRKVLADASMPHPSGAYFWFEIVWRGVVYGTIDALLLFVFPAAVAHLVWGRGDGRRIRVAAVTLLLSLVITASYHVGYPQFRDGDLAQPEIGAVAAWVPTAVTGNPIGAIVAHDAFHVAANVHTYRSPTYLPPDLDGYAEHGGGLTGGLIAGAWMLGTIVVVVRERRHLFPTDR